MLFPKMLLSFLIAKRKYHKNNNTNINQGLGIINNNEDENEDILNDKLIIDNNENINNIPENEEPKFSDFMVASIIETIEFVLGTVSILLLI